MIQVTFPNNYISERSYIIDVILSQFLNLKFEIKTYPGKDYLLLIDKNKKVIIKDYFFSHISQKDGYLHKTHLPKNIKYITQKSVPFIPEFNMPVIYGTPEILIKDHEIISGVDIFSSSFFMLTRWEEYVITKRDSHNRFPGEESIAYKNGFLNRPVVNEYTEMLWNMFQHLGYRGERKKRTFQVVPTFDVDVPLKYPYLLSGLKQIVGDIIKRRNFQQALKTFFEKTAVHFKLKQDPYNTFEKLLKSVKVHSMTPYFYFMSGGNVRYDNRDCLNHPFVKKLVLDLKQHEAVVGIHPGYETYNNPKELLRQKQELEQTFETTFTVSRQHFLRFEVPQTWQYLETAGVLYDSSMNYASKEGFRCGVCYDFPVFNILTRQTLKIREIPLLFMDGNFATYQSHLSYLECKKSLSFLIKKVRRYGGAFVFLWHNSNFSGMKWKRYSGLYDFILSHDSQTASTGLKNVT